MQASTNSTSFIDELEQLDFDRPNRRYQRLVKELGGNSDAPPQDLEALVSRIAKQLEAEVLRGFQCLAILVDEGHGMTWSAEAVGRALVKCTQRTKIHLLAGELDSPNFPRIEEVLRWRRIARLAQQHGIHTGGKVLGWRVTLIIVFAAVVFSAMAAALTALIKGVQATDLIQFGVLCLILGVAVIGGKLLTDLIPRPGLSRKTKIDLAEALRAGASRRSRDYGNLVNDVVINLAQLPDSRTIVIDDFTQLDDLTRDVITSYLERDDLDDEKERRSELWVIFCRSDYKWFTSKALGNRHGKSFGLRRTRVFAMQNFTPEQRREIAIDVQKPERASWLAVRAITRDLDELKDVSTALDELHSERRPEHGKQRQADLLDFFYILAVGATAADNPWLREREIVSRFSQKHDVRTRLLQSMLPRRTLTLENMRIHLGEVKSVLSPMIDINGEGESRSLRVRAEIGSLLIKRFRSLDLCSPGIVHLFWSLYWYDTRRISLGDPEWLKEISRHLLESAHPAELADVRPRWSGEEIANLRNSQFEMYVHIIRASLSVCMLEHLVALLMGAMALAGTEDDSLNRRYRKRLSPLVWDAYNLLGDDRILNLILELNENVTDLSKSGDDTPRSEDSTGSLEYLFVESLPNLNVSSGEGRMILAAQIEKDATLTTFACVRGAWIVSALRPLGPCVTPRLNEIVSGARENLLDVMAVELESTMSPEYAENSHIEYLSASLGIWSLGVLSAPRQSSNKLTTIVDELLVSKVRPRAISCLVSGFYQALELRRRQREATDEGNENLVLDVLAVELFLSTLASAVVMVVSRPDDSIEKELHEIVTECAAALHVHVPGIANLAAAATLDRLVHEVEKYMAVMQVAWRSLGFEYMAALMSARQAQFVTVVEESDEGTIARVIDVISGDFGAQTHIEIVAQLIAADSAVVSTQLQAQLLVRATIGAIDAKLGEGLVRELCILCIKIGHSFTLDLDRLLGYLTKPDAGESVRLDEIFKEISDEVFSNLCLPLLNVIGGEAGQPYRQFVITSMKRRAEIVTSEMDRRQVAQQFAVFEMIHSAADDLDVNTELDRWAPWREADGYAFVLYWLKRRASSAAIDRLYAEALQVLRARGGYLQTTGFVFLALEMFGDKRAKSGRRLTPDGRVILSALADAVYKWEPHLQVDTNIQAFQTLYAYDEENRDIHQVRLRKWQKIDLESYGVEQLPNLVADGSFFFIWWYYYSVFAHEGLRSDPHVNPFGLSSQQIEQELLGWRKSNSPIPEPIVRGPSGRSLSGKFLALGFSLLNMTSEQESSLGSRVGSLRDARSMIHSSAAGGIRELYELIRVLPGLPTSISRVLDRHQELTKSAPATLAS